MKMTYDKKVDAMYIYLTSKRKKITDTKETDNPGVLIDYAGNEPVGIEIINASKVLGSKLGFKTSKPTVSYAHKIR